MDFVELNEFPAFLLFAWIPRAHTHTHTHTQSFLGRRRCVNLPLSSNTGNAKKFKEIRRNCLLDCLRKDHITSYAWRRRGCYIYSLFYSLPHVALRTHRFICSILFFASPAPPPPPASHSGPASRRAPPALAWP